MLTYHGVPATVWLGLAEAADYQPEGFAREGFIHTSPDAQALAAALNRHCAADPRPYLALVIDLQRVAAPWRISYQSDLAVDFPLFHGPLNRDAVLAVLDVPRSPEGCFLPPGPFDGSEHAAWT